MNIATKRVYDPASESDGLRVLVDRLRPRGISREKAHIDIWAKDVAPSNDLRHWFNHDPARWDEFRARYLQELSGGEPATALEELRVKLTGAVGAPDHSKMSGSAGPLDTDRALGSGGAGRGEGKIERITLLYAARDEEHNNALVLGALLNKLLKSDQESLRSN